MLGLMVGAPLFGRVSDAYGRKPILFLSIIFSTAFGAACSFANGFLSFFLFRYDISSYLTVDEDVFCFLYQIINHYILQVLGWLHWKWWIEQFCAHNGVDRPFKTGFGRMSEWLCFQCWNCSLFWLGILHSRLAETESRCMPSDSASFTPILVCYPFFHLLHWV